MTERTNRSVESYAHKAAKAVVAEWLMAMSRAEAERMDAERTISDNHLRLAPLMWRLNRRQAPYGIWQEYPVCLSMQGVVWDEWDNRYTDRPPTRQEVIGMGMHPDFILDIAVQHKGAIAYGIEIVHKHAITEHKRRLIERSDIDVLEIPAAWVLGQVGRPDSFKILRRFGWERAA